jgi:hypothetical protein
MILLNGCSNKDMLWVHDIAESLLAAAGRAAIAALALFRIVCRSEACWLKITWACLVVGRVFAVTWPPPALAGSETGVLNGADGILVSLQE